MTKHCMHAHCSRTATWGVYGWEPGETIVNLKRPVRIVCGPHKPRHSHRTYLRNVKLGK